MWGKMLNNNIFNKYLCIKTIFKISTKKKKTSNVLNQYEVWTYKNKYKIWKNIYNIWNTMGNRLVF